MHAVYVIKWEVNDSELIHKFESDEIRLGSQLIVYPSQLAFFVKGGEVMDEFTSGTYTIKSNNIPLLGKLINIPFNGETPFKAEVYFVNLISILNNKWGTTTPLQVEDHKYDVIVPIRAYGQYGMRISNPRLFMKKLVGNMSSFETSKVVDYFKGVLLSKLTNIVYDALCKSNQSVLNISSQIESLSVFAQEKLSAVFEEYGLSLELFQFISISIKEDDPSFIQLKQAKDAKAKINILGLDSYKMIRSFDILEEAEGNQSGMAGAAMGIGAGIGFGNAAASLTSNILNTQSQQTPPPISQNKTYFLAINGSQYGPFSFDDVLQKINSHQIDATTLVWTATMSQWCTLSECADFSNLFSNCPPPIPKQK